MYLLMFFCFDGSDSKKFASQATSKEFDANLKKGKALLNLLYQLNSQL